MCTYMHILARIHMFQMNNIIGTTCSNDSTQLWQEIGHYDMPNPSATSISPPIHNGSASMSHLGVNHPFLACMLCPIEAVEEYENDPTEWVIVPF